MALPHWDESGEVYGRAYRVLERMAAAGHATPGVTEWDRRGRSHVIVQGSVSREMRDLIDALNKGDERRIRAAIQLQEAV